MENEVRGSFQTKFFYLNKEVKKKSEKSKVCEQGQKSNLFSSHTRKLQRGEKIRGTQRL